LLRRKQRSSVVATCQTSISPNARDRMDRTLRCPLGSLSHIDPGVAIPARLPRFALEMIGETHPGHAGA
jgi:hypothetical protein